MLRTTIASSNLRSIGYDPAHRILEIEFSNGSIYQYAGVEPSTYEDLSTAPSAGRFFHTFIRDRYPTDDASSVMIS